MCIDGKNANSASTATSQCRLGLKVPKPENFHLTFVTARNHFWVDDLGTVPKNCIFNVLSNFVFDAHAQRARKIFYRSLSMVCSRHFKVL